MAIVFTPGRMDGSAASREWIPGAELDFVDESDGSGSMVVDREEDR